MLKREDFDRFIEQLMEDHEQRQNQPDVIMVGKHWGIDRIRQVVKSGAMLMCDKATYDWIQENL